MTRSLRQSLLFAGAAMLVVVGFAAMRLGYLREPLMGVDPAIYLTVAEAMGRGERLYDAVWDHKPPGIYLLYQGLLALRPSAQTPILAGLAAMAFNGVLLFGITRRLLGAWAGLAAAWFLAVYTALFWASAPNAEVFLLSLQLLTLRMWLPREDRPLSRGRLFLGGAALGVAVMIKYVVLLPVLGLALWLAWQRRRRAAAAAPGWPVWIYLLGVAAGMAPFLGYCALQGVWTDFVAGTLAYNAGYVVTDAWGLFWQYGRWFVLESIAQHWGLWLLAVAGVAMWVWRRPVFSRPGGGVGPGLILVWLLASLAAAAAPLKFLDHYFLLAVPALCFWAAYPLRDNSPLAGRPQVAVAALMLVLSLPVAAGRTSESLARWRHLPADPYGPAYGPAEVGRHLRERTGPGDRIYVWRSLDTDIYFHARRTPASRIFFWPHLLRQPPPPGGLSRVEAEFRARPPAYVVVGQSPVYADRSLPFLDRMLTQEYALDGDLYGHRLYRRRGPPGE